MRTHLLSLAVALSSVPSFAMSDDELRAALERRFKDDRTGACVAAAVIDKGTTASAYVCAKSQRPYDKHTAFEIGSNSKPMTAALLAELIARGEVTLDDPIAKLLPAGTSVPSFNGREITIRDIVTHTSGLPSFPLAHGRHEQPLRHLDRARSARHLGRDQVDARPRLAMGIFEFRDNGALLRARQAQRKGLRDVAARTTAGSARHERHLRRQAPAARSSRSRSPLQRVAYGAVGFSCRHGRRRRRARDLARYGALSRRPARHAREHDHPGAGAHATGSRQGQRPYDGYQLGDPVHREDRNGRTIVMHGGGTGGYSSFVAFDRAAKRAVVLLSDTALASFGGLGQLGLHLLDPSRLAGAPRIAATADAKLIDALVGRYRLQTGLGIDLRRKDNALTTQADAQPEFEMGYDSAGDFYPLAFDALLRPKRKADGTYTFTWFQLGGALEAARITPAAGRGQMDADRSAAQGVRG